jgi:hypothetical protein
MHPGATKPWLCGNIGETVERVFSQEQVTQGVSNTWDEWGSIRFSARLELEPLWVSKERRLAVLWYFIQFINHVSHMIFGNPCNNFFSILADFGDLSEKLKSHVSYKLNEILQYSC